MEYIYSAMLLSSVGKKVTEANVKKVLEGAGAKVDEAKIKALVSSLEGVDIKEVVSQAALPVATVPATTAKEEKVEEKKEEGAKKEEEKSAEATNGLASLFG